MDKGLTNMMMLNLTNEIGNHSEFKKFGVELGFSYEDMIDYGKKNKKDTSEGLGKMLIAWKKKNPKTETQIPEMKIALGKAGLADVAKSFFEAIVKMETAAKKAKLRKESKAGTSTATADNKPTTESKPAKKPAQKGSKTMDTKPTSGASKKPAKAKDAPKPKTSTVTTKETTTVRERKTVTEKKGTK